MDLQLKCRKIHEQDWDYIPAWYEQHNQPVPQRSFFPENGLGGFVVCKGKDPIAIMWLWLTNSKTAIPAVVISDKTYQDTDRSDALQLLIDFTTDFGYEMGYEFAFAWAKPGVLLERYLKTGYTQDQDPSYELILQY